MVLLSCMILSEGCMKEESEKVDWNRGDIQSNMNKPHFQLHPNKLKELRDRVEALKLGEKRTAIMEIMGPANREEWLAPKKGLDLKCRALVYYTVIFDEIPGSGRDKSVSLVFDRQDILIAIISNEVDEITNRGDMSVCR